MSPSIDPIVPWPVVLILAVVITWLTLWAYSKRLSTTSGRWRWVALSLRLMALALCLLASMRPSVVFQKKATHASTVAFLSDASESMTFRDEANNQKRWEAARKALAEGMKAAKALGPKVKPQAFRFDTAVADDKVDDRKDPKGSETQIGTAMQEVLKRLKGDKILAIVLLSDGSNNGGRPPLVVAQMLKTQGVPVVTVGFGSDTAGAASKDIAVRSMNAGPTVYVKNELNVSGMLSVKGFPNQELDVELLAEGEPTPVFRTKVRVKGSSSEIPVTGLKWTPQKAGETLLTLRVKPRQGESITSNNEYKTYVTVLGGGLNVLYLAGRYGAWEARFMVRALDPSQKIQVVFKKLVEPADETLDADFVPGAYDVYILGDLPAEMLSVRQQQLLARRVEAGAGLMMLGGHHSFGAGGWANTPVGDLLPTNIHPGDGQIEPEGGMKVIPNPLGLDSYVLKLARDRVESRKIWEALPNIPGANRLGPPKGIARVWALDPSGEPLIVAEDLTKGRILAFGGETWPWARFSEESRLAHIKFWRQSILWLAHKENENDSQVRLALDHRRVSVGGRVQLTVDAKDAKGEPIPNIKYTGTITRDAPKAEPETVDIYPQGDEGRGTHYVTGEPGDYKVEVTAIDSAGKTIGKATSRFIAYRDDREMENPSADSTLLKQIAEITGGKAVPPEQLSKYLGTLDKEVTSEYVTQSEVRIWDNWWFLIAFATLLTLEWWLRKRHGWV